MLQSEEFDYVIVGAGAAGCLVAARLTEDPNVTVCVLEAGPSDLHPYVHIPGGFFKLLFNEKYTWQFKSEPCAGTCGRQIVEIQGRVLGGGSSVNGMIYNRGQPADFDQWAQSGNSGWGYADILPYFKRSERRVGAADEEVRGRAGSLPITDADWADPLSEAFINGAVAEGFPRNPDYNAGLQYGIAYTQCVIERGLRRNAVRSFLRPAMKRGILEVRTRAHVQAVLFERDRAVGVRYADLNGGRDTRKAIRVRREVIMCAGAINTPKLLQISGVGPAAILEEIGVPMVRDLPVGRNLQNHFIVQVVAKVQNCVTINEYARMPRFLGQIARWLSGSNSILALPAATVILFGKSDPALANSDFQGVFAPASLKQGSFGLLDAFPGMTLGVRQNRPESVGYVRARSADAFEAPIVQPNYLTAASDCVVLVSAIRQARSLFRTKELSPYLLREELPGDNVQTYEEILDFARQRGASSYHMTGTARMGPRSDPSAVVDDQLRVHGVRGLRIVDASIMPNVPSANTYASTLMVAEKASDMIRGLPTLTPGASSTAVAFREQKY
jgi:choline dehydrogenase